ncbi:hypothetical protein HELRODRAFT_99817 [Helobdella robusta]|uniref:Ketoreductase domain-containing protein n=1 Tax=Helobdella robusta TaxID=6412 RepID=T1G9V4_HELRO|nr:hypothetical protein HELRODRAFT_99817 [Helobdella robusta]ESO04013.1 hypothetical protein HELRODRAFT_99817 [Helobdella robusta]
MASNIFHLTGKVALITGAGSGIGAETAILFSKLGASIAIVGRNEKNLQSTKEKCIVHCKGVEPLMIPGDVTNEKDCKNMVETVIGNFKKLDILVNSAGVLEMGSIETTTLLQYDNVMNVNVRAIYHLTMLCVPHLKKVKGNIVNVSSVCGTRSFPGVLAYCVSKSALDQLTSCTALELAPHGVRVNAVNPGVIVTELHKRSGSSDEEYKAFIEKTKLTHPLGRPGTPDEVANAIAYLASDLALNITGEHLHVDGGRHAACPR